MKKLSLILIVTLFALFLCACGKDEESSAAPTEPATSVHVHTEAVDAAKPATCTEAGLTEGKHCSVCGEVLQKQETVPALGHTEVIDAAKPATCLETGLTEGKHCSVCNTVLQKQEEIPKTGHTEAIDAAKPATCTEKGLTEGKHCSVCGEVLLKQEEVEASGHTEVKDEAKDATCTEAGLTEGSHCSVCGEVLQKQEEIAALGHKYKKTVVKPTTSAGGYTKYKCSRCGDSYKDDFTDKLEETVTFDMWIWDDMAAEIGHNVAITCPDSELSSLLASGAHYEVFYYGDTDGTSYFMNVCVYGNGDPAIFSVTADIASLTVTHVERSAW